MASETERTKMAAIQRAAPLLEVEGEQLWALMFLPVLSIILGLSCSAKAEVAQLGAAWVMVQALESELK